MIEPASSPSDDLQAVIFDMDGVLCDTAEYHYQSWARLAEEESLPFDRAVNERLRGRARRDSLRIILDGRPVSEDDIRSLMARKQAYFEEMLALMSPADLLPGVAALLDQLDEAGIPYAVASSSANARAVTERIAVRGRLAALADAHSVERKKPYPDLFRHAAAELGVPPEACLVIEDGAVGVEAAFAAGMPVLALGPRARFERVAAGGRVTVRADLAGITLAELRAAFTGRAAG